MLPLYSIHGTRLHYTHWVLSCEFVIVLIIFQFISVKGNLKNVGETLNILQNKIENKIKCCVCLRPHGRIENIYGDGN